MKQPSRTSLILPLATFCLFLSGMGSLVLEVVWTRALELVFGSTTLAVSTVLVAFMLGLGLGGLFGGNISSRLRNPVRAYALIEIAVSAYAMLVPFVIDLYPLLNRAVLHPLPFWPSSILRFFFVLVLLVLPTLLMGATLPLLVAALVRGSSAMASRVGLLYGVNTLGAVTGTLAATFLFFPKIGLFATNFAGATIDLAAGLIAFLLIPATSQALPDLAREPVPTTTPPRRWSWPLVSYGLVGLTALAYEVCWTRSLTMVFGSSVYAFSTMLAAFLSGIALGSLVARRWIDRIRRPLLVYALGLVALGLASLATIPLMSLMPSLFLDLMLWLGITGKALLTANVVLSFATMLVPTLILGALFPLLVRAVTGPDRGPSTSVGDVYFVNTVGSALGSFVAGFVLIPWLGVRQTIALAVTANLLVAATVLFRYLPRPGYAYASAGTVALLGLLVAAFPPEWNRQQLDEGVYQRPTMFMDFGVPRIPIPGIDEDELLFYEEGLNTTVSVHRIPDGLVMRVNGKTDASEMDMNTQVLSGHLPILFGGPSEKTLVIGYASGITAGAVSLHEPERLAIAEIEPEIIAASRYFEELNHRPLDEPFTELIVDDGRHYLDATDAKYDIIISEPSNPWITGCSNLFTKEFFGIARERLEPGGRLLQWIQLYGMDGPGLRSVLSAITDAFPHVYGFMHSTSSVDLLLMASDRPLDATDLPRWDELDPAVRDDLRRVDVHSSEQLWSLLALTPEDLRRLAREAPVKNTDDNMFVELRAPLLLYEAAEGNLDLVSRQASGIAPLMSGALEHFEPAEIGETGLAYLMHRGNHRLAERLFRVASLTGSRAHPLVYQALGAARSGGPNLEQAQRLVDRSARAAPDLFSPHFYRARILRWRGRHQQALEAAEAALAIDPSHLPARRERLRALGALGRVEEAYEEARALLKTPLRSTERKIVAEAGVLASAVGDHERSAELLKSYLARQPYSPREWNMLARVRQRQGLEAKATRALENAKLAEENLVRHGRRQAYAMERSGERSRAREMLRRLRQRFPDDPGLAEHMRELGMNPEPTARGNGATAPRERP
jgi:spermidine synthase